jgi:uncharacterized protein YbjT (DUF2867 family)
MSSPRHPPAPHPTAERPIAVAGATGEQGGAVARDLLARRMPVRALVHNRAMARATADVNVPHAVYSSVGGVDRDTGIPHFESKREIERTLLELGVPTTFIRPTFFMDNFSRFMAPSQEDGTLVLRLPMPGDVPLQRSHGRTGRCRLWPAARPFCPIRRASDGHAR